MKKLSIFLALISLSILFIFSCQKDKTYQAGDSHNSNLRTTITGIVLDESNAPLNGVTVTAYGQTTSTNQFGTFVLKNLNVNKDRCVLQFAKAGFFNRTHAFIAAGNTVNYTRIILLSNAPTQNFSSSVGGLISLPDGSSAEFQPNSFVTANGSAYTGTVNLIVKHLSPDDANFGFTIPGGDVAGVNANEEDVILYTYGMLGVELTGSSGEALQLATGTSATLTLSIAASQLATAPATIPLWFFDETTSLWKEEGMATKVGNNYVGTVAHFSWWNCDDPNVFSKIKGKVVDCNGIALPNIVVSLNGVGGALTNQNGEFTELFIMGATSLMELQVLTTNNWGIFNSQIEIIPTLSANQVFTVPDLVVPCPTRVAGTIKTCSGENTEGFVTLSDNAGFSIFQYTTNGSFNMVSIPNAQMELNAFNSSHSTYQTITSLSAPNILNVGNILLCDTGTTSVNYFILDGGEFSNQLFNINMTFCDVAFSQGSTHIALTGSAPPDFNIYNYEIHIGDTIQGPDTLLMYIDMASATNSYILSGSNVTCNLIQVGPVGNKIKGNYSGVANIWVNGIQDTSITISGTFDVIRTQ